MKKQAKTDNYFLAPKLYLRRFFLKKYFANKVKIKVMDCCAGDRVIWSNLMVEFPNVEYVGFDVKPDKSKTFKIDSSRILEQPSSYDVVDIDTYGEPWGHYFNLLKNNKTKDIVVFFTIGLVKMSGGACSKLAKGHIFGNLASKIPNTIAAPYIFNNAQILIEKAIDFQYVIEEMQEAFPQNNARYIGAKLVKK